MENTHNPIFHCYSFRLCHFLQSQGFRYISKGLNPNNNLTYFSFLKSKKLNESIQTWNSLKEKSKLEEI